MKVLGIAVLAVAMMMTASGALAKGKGGNETKLKAALTVPVAGGAKIGHAEFESKVKNGTTSSKLEVEVGQITLPVGTQVNFQVNGQTVGSATVKADDSDDDDSGKGVASTGEAKLVLKTPKDTVPAIVKGSTISVSTTDGIVFASGTF